MKPRPMQFFSVFSCAIFITACGGGGNDGVEPVVVEDPNPEVAFFNNDAQIDYVDSMIGRFLTVFRPLSTLSGDVLDDDSVAKRTIAALTTESFDCSGGGSFDISITTDDVTEELESASINLANCVEGGETTNGSIALTANLDSTGDNGTVTFTVSNFSVAGGDEDISMNGSVALQTQSTATSSEFSISGSNFSVTAGGESIAFSNFSINAIDNEAAGTSSLSAAMTVSSDVDGTITFAIDPPLAGNSSDDYPTSGVLALTHSDGSSLTIDADNGDPETFNFTINDGGTTTSGVERWDETELVAL